MRIAFLFPAKTHEEYSLDNVMNDLLSQVTKGMNSEVWKVSKFIISNKGGFFSSGRISASANAELIDIFENADEFEIIVNGVGAAPLPFTRFFTTPVVSLVFPFDNGSMDSIYKKYNNKNNYFLALTDIYKMESIDYISSLFTNTEDAMPPNEAFGCLTWIVNNIESHKLAYTFEVLFNRIHEITVLEGRRPWGYYAILLEKSDYKVKEVCVVPGMRLSLQRHKRRREHWQIVKGSAIVTLDGEKTPLVAGENINIPKGAIHRIENIGTENMVFIEVQEGEYFGEDDIERLEDDYGRSN